MKAILDARDLQREPWQMNRRQAYAVLHTIGIRLTERRLVVLQERLEEFLRGGAAP